MAQAVRLGSRRRHLLHGLGSASDECFPDANPPFEERHKAKLVQWNKAGQVRRRSISKWSNSGESERRMNTAIVDRSHVSTLSQATA